MHDNFFAVIKKHPEFSNIQKEFGFSNFGCLRMYHIMQVLEYVTMIILYKAKQNHNNLSKQKKTRKSSE